MANLALNERITPFQARGPPSSSKNQLIIDTLMKGRVAQSRKPQGNV